MNLKSFNNLYNLKESTIIDIYNNTNSLFILASFEFYQEFIANGCRSDFDYEETYLFEFKNSKCEIDKSNLYLISDTKLEEDKLILVINNKKYIIKCDEVIINKK